MVTETFEKLSEMKSKMGPGELIIRLKEAKNVGGDDFMCLGTSDMYVLFSLGGEQRKSKVTSKGGRSPVWNETLSFKIAPHVKFELYSTLHLHLYDDDTVEDDPRGTVKIDIETLLQEHENEVPFKIYPVDRKGRQRGTVELAVSFIPNFKKRTLRHFLSFEE